jgi:hypothetical protein
VVHGVQVIVHDGDDGLAQVVVVVASRGELRIGGAIFGAVDAECVEQGTAPRAQVLHLGRERREVVTEEVLCVIDERGRCKSMSGFGLGRGLGNAAGGERRWDGANAAAAVKNRAGRPLGVERTSHER